MIYEIFGGRDTIIKNLMKQFDSDGDLLNANGVAGMDVTGKGTSWQKLRVCENFSVNRIFRSSMIKYKIIGGLILWQEKRNRYTKYK